LQQLLEMPRKSWWARLPFGLRMTAGASALLVAIGGGAAGIAALTKDEPRVVTATARESVAGVGAAPANKVAEPPVIPDGSAAKPPAALIHRREASEEADRTATRNPRPPAPVAAAATSRAPVQPQVTRKTVTETRPIPFRTQLVRDPSMPRGARRVQSEGVPGEETLRYLVTYVGGRETERQLVGSSVTREPQPQVLAVGGQQGPGGFGGPGGPRGPGGPGRHRECGPHLRGCLPIGRSACPREDHVEESGAVQLGGSLDVADEDLLDGLELDPGMIC
jgi:G5 domain